MVSFDNHKLALRHNHTKVRFSFMKVALINDQNNRQTPIWGHEGFWIIMLTI